MQDSSRNAAVRLGRDRPRQAVIAATAPEAVKGFKLATMEEISEREEDAARRVTAAEADVQRAESALAAAVDANETELNVARAHQALEDSRGKLRVARERHVVCAAARERASLREQQALRDEAIRSVQRLLVERNAEFKKLDAIVDSLVASFERACALSKEALRTLPERPGWLPATCDPGALAKMLAIQLLARSNGEWVVPRVPISTWEAGQQPTFTEKSQREGEDLLRQFPLSNDRQPTKARA